MLTGNHVAKYKSPATEDYSITTPNPHRRILQEPCSHSTTLHLYRSQNGTIFTRACQNEFSQ